MGSHSWKNRVFPPLIIATVIGGVWYAAAHREDPIIIPAVAASTPKTVTPDTVPAVNPAAATLLPTIKKVYGQVQLSVNTASLPRVQKVEFYVGTKLVGAAFSTPYSVSLDENSLTPGSHQVTAKIYTPETTSETPPANFTSQQTDATSGAAIGTGVAVTNSSTATTPAQDTTVAMSPGEPTNVVATEQVDNSVIVSWNAPSIGSTVVSYQVWRDSSMLSTTTNTTYSDTTTVVGSSYDYKIIAVDANGDTSEPAESGNTPITDKTTPAQQPVEPQAQAVAPTSAPTATPTD